jgi:TRAP-type C4-dicarboxylate transport system permease small subunit
MTIDRMRGTYEKVLEWLCIILMVVLFLEVFLGVVFRTFGESLVWYDEVASILLAWLTFYGSALASVKRAHIGCPEVMALMPPRVKFAFRVVAEVSTIAFFVLMGWTGYKVLGVLEGDSLVSLPDVSIAWVQSVVPISSVLIVAAELLTLPGVLKKTLHPPAITGGASQ